MLSRERIAARVAESAAVLDQHVPDWIGRIDIETMDVSDSKRCPLGQLYRGFEVGTRALQGLGVRASRMDGFVTLSSYSGGESEAQKEYRLLTEEWTRLITERRAKSTLLAA